MSSNHLAQDKIKQNVMDHFDPSNKTTTFLHNELDQSTDIEVYLLFKALYNYSYFPDRFISHHVLLFKIRQQDNAFYYTDLDSSNFGFGTIKIVFGPYTFYSQKSIYYQPLGISRNKTLAEIKRFAEESTLNGQKFSMFAQNCQHYVSSCIEFLGLDKSKLHSSTIYWAKEAQDITPRPSSKTRASLAIPITSRLLIVLCTFLTFKLLFGIGTSSFYFV